jgi:AraC family transcriptional regulator of adaptative response/methylated-DNA-[protein]-cysteine methyltransferase
MAKQNPADLDDAARWRAVTDRDPAARGAFVYAVLTTGVYCAPGCASRRPRPENVRFFASPAAAEAAGFRSCKRCRPDAASVEAPGGAAVLAACRAASRALEEGGTPRLADLAHAAGVSARQLQRLFAERLGLSPRGYVARLRQERAAAALAAGGGGKGGGRGTVLDAAFGAGFGAGSRFYAAAPAFLGMLPATFRAGGPGESIAYALAPTSLGLVLAAATERGLCSIALGDDAPALTAELRRRFPRADLIPAGPEAAAVLARVAALVETPAQGLGLPLDIRGTAFQRRVWAELQKVPAGQTTTYARVAESLGRPGAARAVARACAANPLALAVPCHRVVRGDGALAGYFWGLARKRALLDREANAPGRGSLE